MQTKLLGTYLCLDILNGKFAHKMAKRACSVLLAVFDYLGVHNAIKHHTRIACATSKVVSHVSALRQPTAHQPVLVVVVVLVVVGGTCLCLHRVGWPH